MARMRRAIGVVRVSEVGVRDATRYASPDEQEGRIRALCEREGMELLRVLPEIDISGGAPLAQRPGLSVAVQMIEDGRADVVVVGYFDRLVRSLRVQEEVVSRVEASGGGVVAADVGAITNGSAATWLSSNMLGMVNEYQRRSTAERTRAAQERAVALGRPPFPLIPGLRRARDGSVELDPELGPVVRRAFEMRAAGASFPTISSYLAEHGIRRARGGVATLFQSPLAVGEIVFGDLRGETGVQLVDQELFDRVRRMVTSRGRTAKSERLLARLGVLRCGNCGGRMSANVKSVKERSYPFYRCTSTDCTRRATVSAPLVEQVVVETVKRRAAALRGRASTAARARELRSAADRDQEALNRVIGMLDGFEDEPAALERLAGLRAARDASSAVAVAAEAATATIEITAQKDWDDLDDVDRRALIVSLIEHVSVTPGRSDDRIRVGPVPAMVSLFDEALVE